VSTCTRVYQLPLPEGTDRPCDYSEISCGFATGVETQLDLLDGVVLRTATTIPMAWVRTTTPYVVAQNATQSAVVTVPFDTVVVDTDQMSDLAQFSSGVTTTRDGLYLVWVYFRAVATVAAAPNINHTLRLFVEPALAVNNAYFQSLDTTSVTINQVVRRAQATVMPIPAGTQVGLRWDASGAPTDAFTLPETDLALTWVGDLP
jgi:hypothetical protein